MFDIDGGNIEGTNFGSKKFVGGSSNMINKGECNMRLTRATQTLQKRNTSQYHETAAPAAIRLDRIRANTGDNGPARGDEGKRVRLEITVRW